MQIKKNNPLPLLTCETCQGTTRLGRRACLSCRGLGTVLPERGHVWYYGQPLTRFHIRLRAARHVAEQMRFLLALCTGLAFIGWFFFLAAEHSWWIHLFSWEFWTITMAPGKFLWWLGLIFLLYTVYAVMRLGEIERVLAEVIIPPSKLDEPVLETDVSWTAISHLSKAKRHDIAPAFTVTARQAIERAYAIAVQRRGSSVLPIDMLSALLSTSSVASIFVRLNIPVKALQKHLANIAPQERAVGEPETHGDAAQIIFQAFNLALTLHDERVRETELLVATLAQSESLQELLYDLHVDQTKLMNVLSWVRIREQLREEYRTARRAAAHRSKYGIDRAMTAVATPYLNSFSEDLTLAAKFGNLAPCVARQEEIADIFRIIEGGRQSVLLVGERGVGKMTIIEGIANSMIAEKVPARLQDKRLVQLSTSALLAGTDVRGAQERLLRIMNELSRAKNIILCINNIHDLINPEGGMDVSETLAEFLGSGRFLTIATTVPEAFNQQILRSALGKVCARVDIHEMDFNQAIQALESKVGSIEYKHKIFFSYDALEKAVQLCKTFLVDVPLPESAVAILSEVASHVRSTKGENHIVMAEDVALIISRKTGIPATTVTEDEREKLLRLEDEMHKRVVGQSEAVTLVASALRRARANMRASHRPIATFLFLGPTGVGKTELAKTIAEVYFGGEDRMIRLDMSEYQDTASIYRLIGRPGEQGTGFFTESVRQRPFSLILLDELEKASADVLNLFLQVFDDARLTDSTGHTIDFTNTIIIATSNAGTDYAQTQLRAGKDMEVIRDALIRSELKQYYRPEFLNRFDGIVLFKPLDKESIKQIAGYMLQRVGRDLLERGITLEVTEAALDSLAAIGYDPDFGARPMRRAIQERVENQLADLILKNQLPRRATVVIDKNVIVSIKQPTF